jgi:hypothetical protein
MPNWLQTASLIVLVFLALERRTEATVTSVVVDPAGPVFNGHPTGLQQSAVKRKQSRQHGRDLIAGSASILLEANASSGEEQRQGQNKSAIAWPLVRRAKRAEVTQSQSSRTEVAELLHKFKKYLDGKYDEVAFHYSPIQRTYAESVKYCLDRGSEIADIRTKFEQAEAKALVHNDHKGFVGATTDGSGIWTWNSGFPWSYVGPNQGLDGKDPRKRVVMLSNGAWTEVPKGFYSGVLCREKMFSVVDPDEVATNTGLVKFFAVNNKCFKIAVRDYVKLGKNEPEFGSNECLEKDWQEDFDLGTYKNTSHSTQFYTGGTESSNCPDGARRSSNLVIYKSSKAKSVHAVMDETPVCNFNIHLVGPESLLLGKETEGGESGSTGSSGANQNAESESGNAATSGGTSSESANTATDTSESTDTDTSESANTATSSDTNTSDSTNTATSSDSDDKVPTKTSASPATQKAAVGNSVTMIGAISGIIALVMMVCVLAWFWKSRQSGNQRSASAYLADPAALQNERRSSRRSSRRNDDRSQSPASDPSTASFERDETPLPSPRGGGRRDRARDRGPRAG